MNKLSILLLTTILTACSLAPNFKLPDSANAKSFKEAKEKTELKQGVWKVATPLAKEDKGQWWKVFNDSKLDELEKQAISANQSLKAAAARVEQSRAIVRANSASFLPDINLGGNAVRAKAADASTAGFSKTPANNLKPYNLYAVGATASYDVDLFNRVRDSEKAFSFDAEAQSELYRNSLLALQADVAQHYFLLQSLDAERELLKNTVSIRSEANRIMQKRFDVGTVNEIDLSFTKSELAIANSDLINLNRQRSVLENAMAILLGQNPSEYHFAETPNFNITPPLIPAGIPSELLQRRPDIAIAQAQMKAANIRIGVARAAFFPSLNLTANGGFQSTELGDIFKWSSRTWALGQTAGTALAMNIFDSGRNFGQLDSAHSAYDAAVANYRNQVLVAMGDVENALNDQKLLAEQSQQQDIAAQATTRTLDLTQKRYTQGDVNYFEVATAQAAMLATNRASIQTHAQRVIATINLIRALGGSWAEK